MYFISVVPCGVLSSTFSLILPSHSQPNIQSFSVLICSLSGLLSLSYSALFIHCLFPSLLLSPLVLCSVSFSLSLCSFPFFPSIQCLLSVSLRSHTQIHLVLLFISLPINLMFPSSLLFSSHVFNLSLSLSSSITHPHSYPAVTV